jgi:hypothetical protein
VKQVWPIAELSRVVLLTAYHRQGFSLPEGTTGVVVHVHGDGIAYEVEIMEPVQCVITVEAGDIQPV